MHVCVCVQCVGAIVGSGLAKVVSGTRRFDASYGGTNHLGVDVDEGQALLGEVSCYHS
jgi:tRNA(Arg) A34 adenosine deaminase TadA